LRHLLLYHEVESERRVIEANNVGSFYRHVNKRMSNRSGIAPVYDAQGTLVTDDQTKAKLLNNYFALVDTVDNRCFPVVSHRSDSDVVLDDDVFTVDNVKAAIEKLKANLSSGPDDLPPVLFKRSSSVFAGPLSLLFQQLFSVINPT